MAKKRRWKPNQEQQRVIDFMRTHDAKMRITNSYVRNCWLHTSGTNEVPPAVSYRTASILVARGVLVKLDESPWYLTDYGLAPEWKGGQGGKLVESFISEPAGHDIEVTIQVEDPEVRQEV